ncbi:XRE family transcriptional regulator [Paucimonas lemoignei]|jgi:putative transcriptional regulator|nr:XRE family transcriptional regulator [Paucimonas lemoignei]
MSKLFEELMESVQQMDEIVRGERQPSREFTVDAMQIKEIRKATGLSQAKFAAIIDVQLGTLRNWEQGRREPTGPAKALLKAIHNDPVHVLNALAG